MNAAEMSMTSIPKSLQLAAFAKKILDEKRVWCSHKQVVPETLGLELTPQSRDLTGSSRHSSTQTMS